jgi:hypothetical protein
MNRDYKNIFESYKVVREQQEVNPYLDYLIKLINSSKGLPIDVKTKMIGYFSSPENAKGLAAAIEAGQNETANPQTGQAWDYADIPAREPEPTMGTEPEYPIGTPTDLQGNPVNLNPEEE